MDNIGQEIVKTCNFDKKDGCYAMVCYSAKPCGSRDENGNPLYVPLKKIKAEEQN